jgi:outer membrane protein TolC
LEVEAQAANPIRRRMETFAAGTDIHAIQVPMGTHNNEYRPGAVAPEMPTLLVGTPAARAAQAQSLQARAETVVETTRNLIALEAEEAFLRWEEASRQASQARQAAEAGEKLADNLKKDFTVGLKVRVDDLLNAQVLASQARSQYNEYLYRQILALADLERVTAGGFCAGLTELLGPVQTENKAGAGDTTPKEPPQPAKNGQ